MATKNDMPPRHSSLILKKLGRKTAWVEANADSVQSGNYEAYKDFKQGADLMPRAAVLVDLVNENAAQRTVSVRTARTELANKQAKRLKGRQFTGAVNRKYLFTTVTSNMLLPFVICNSEEATVVLPVEIVDGKPVTVTDDDLMNRGDVATAQWFREIDQAIEADPQLRGKPLRERVDFRGKLSQQTLSQDKFRVFVGAGGERPAAAVEPKRPGTNRPLIADQTTYSLSFDVEDEAYYVAGLLNSSVLQRVIADFQPEGQFGKRHIHKLPFQAIPRFDPDNQAHTRLADLSKATTAVAYEALTTEMCDLSRSVGSRRRRLVRQISAELRALDEAASAVLVPQEHQENQ